jgi:hypothetical protein
VLVAVPAAAAEGGSVPGSSGPRVALGYSPALNGFHRQEVKAGTPRISLTIAAHCELTRSERSMREFVEKHVSLVREKGPEWQIKVAGTAIALVTALTFAAHATYQKSFDRHGLAKLASGSIFAKDPPRSAKPIRF